MSDPFGELGQSPPLPRPDGVSDFFWEGLTQG